MLIVLLCAFLADPATSPAYNMFSDPAGRWSIELPADWISRRDSAEFGSADQRVRMTIAWSAGPFPTVAALDAAFPDSKPVGEPQTIEGESWAGITRTYLAHESEQTRIGVMAGDDRRLVTMSLCRSGAFTNKETRTIARIIARLRIHDIAPTTNPAH